MTDLRQIPLFQNQPAAPADLNIHTELRYSIPLFQQHLLKEGKSQHTVNAFTADLQLLAENTGGETPIGEYTTNKLNDFLEWLEHGRGVPCSRKTYARRVTTLKVYFKWLLSIHAIAHDPAKAVLQRSGPAPLAYALSPHEISAALVASRGMKKGDEVDTRPEMLFSLILDTGIKKGEAVALKPSDIDRSNREKPVLMVKHKVKNVYKERRIDLDPDWVRLLDEYLSQYVPKETIFNCTARNLEYILSDIGEAAGVPAKISFEMLRWSSAVRDMRNGQEEDYIRDKLGLSPISWAETGSKIKRLLELQSKS
ncbi:MAG: site-specific integrase [Chloroflexi bacterium]|nr:site-specific integrase [Chloroflexota bacterium]MCC6895574.1 site-specific integrase [Anaerolineae bacterium]